MSRYEAMNRSLYSKTLKTEVKLKEQKYKHIQDELEER